MREARAIIETPTPAARNGLAGTAVWLIGWVSLVLGLIGVVMPLMPTAPFLVLAAACFARTDPAMQQRMLDLPVVGRYLDDLANGRQLPPLLQFLSLLFVWTVVIYSAIVVVKAVWLKMLLFVLAILTSLHVLLMGRGRNRNPDEETGTG